MEYRYGEVRNETYQRVVRGICQRHFSAAIYPELRGKNGPQPRKWFWLARLIPCVHVAAQEIHIGVWRSQYKTSWLPMMSRRRIAISRFGVRWLT